MPRDDRDAEREGADEEHADDGVLLEPPILCQQRDQHGGHDAREGTAEHQGPTAHERDGQAGEHGVRDGIPDERHAAQDDVHADAAAHERGDDCDEQRARQGTPALGRQVSEEVVGAQEVRRSDEAVAARVDHGTHARTPRASRIGLSGRTSKARIHGSASASSSGRPDAMIVRRVGRGGRSQHARR